MFQIVLVQWNEESESFMTPLVISYSSRGKPITWIMSQSFCVCGSWRSVSGVGCWSCGELRTAGLNTQYSITIGIVNQSPTSDTLGDTRGTGLFIVKNMKTKPDKNENKRKVKGRNRKGEERWSGEMKRE